MLTGNECFVVMKLTTGEQIMGVLEQEDATHFQLLSPMIIRTFPIPNEGREHISAHPYCQFTNDNVFDIEKKNVIYIKPLKEIMIPHYKRIVLQHETEGEIEHRQVEKITPEEARKRIKMLANVFGEELEEVLGEEDPTGYFVEGNETKH